MTAEEKDTEMAAEEQENPENPGGEDDGGKGGKKKRAKARRQSGTAVAFQKRTSVRNTPERTTSSHLTERKHRRGTGPGAGLEGMVPDGKKAEILNKNPDRRGSQGAIKAATSAMRAARGVPAARGVGRAASSTNAPRRPDRAVAPVRRKTPARSSSSHGLKPVKRGDRTSETPILTGADLLNLRRAQEADNKDHAGGDGGDGGSVGSDDVESTYTMDSINLRKSQIVHDHELEGDHDNDDDAEEIVDEEIASVGSFGTLDSVKLRHLQVDDEHNKNDEEGDIQGEEEASVSTLDSETDLDALAGAEEEDAAAQEGAIAIDDTK